MSRHPVTPMDEADLRPSSREQTGRPIGLVDFVQLTAGNGAAALARCPQDADVAPVVLIDVLDEETLPRPAGWSGRTADRACSGRLRPGLQYALVAYWRSRGCCRRRRRRRSQRRPGASRQ